MRAPEAILFMKAGPKKATLVVLVVGISSPGSKNP